MNRRKPLMRKTPLRGNPDKIREWKQRTAQRLPARATKRARQERAYSNDRPDFLRAHPICPVTGERTSQVHHSAKREGLWLNLRRYWIAVSDAGHRYIEDHKAWAEGEGLMVRIREDAETHIDNLSKAGVDLDRPIFYDLWNGQPLCPSQSTSNTAL